MFNKAGQIWIGAYDNIDEVRNEMHNKRIHATIEQHPELMGQYGVALAVRALSGEKLPDYTPTPLDLITYEDFDKKIGFSISDLKNPFFAAMEKSAKEAAALFGAQLFIADAGNDEARQMVDIQKFIREKTDAIIVNPTDSVTVTPVIEMAKAAGIAVITVDRKCAKDGLALSHIASDNITGGRMAGEFIGQALGGKGMLMEIEGIPGTSAAHDRSKGFNEAVEKFLELKVKSRVVGDFDRKKAKEAVGSLLKKEKSFDALFAHNDPMVLGALDAFAEAGVPPPKVIVGFDATPEALAAVKEGKITASVGQDPGKMGWLGVQKALQALRKEELPQLIQVELKLIRK
jgi:ABC-type sugar transport system substrate-binding protein